MKSEITFDTRTIARVIGASVAATLLVFLVFQVRGALSLILVIFFLAIVLDRPVNFFQRRVYKGNRKPAVITVLLLVGGVIAGITTAVVPVLIEQGRQIIELVPEYLAALQTQEHVLARAVQRLDLTAGLQDAYVVTSDRLIGSSEPLFNLIARGLSNALVALVTVLATYAALVEGPRWVRRIKELQPQQNRKRREEIARKMHRAVTGFVAGQLLVTTIAATATFIILTIFGVPSPLTLSAVIWLTGLIPLVGNTLGAVIVVLVAFTQSMTIGVVLAIYYIIYQQFENNVLEPIVQAKTIRMTPLTVLLSAIIGIYLAGFLGALLALPVGGSIKILIEEYAKHYRNQQVPVAKNS